MVGLAFPAIRLPLPVRWFPIEDRAAPLPTRDTRLPLSPHCNPYSAPNGQPRRFPPQSNRLLASFAVPVSRSDRPLPWPGDLVVFSDSPTPRKAGYSAHSVHGAGPGSTATRVHSPLRTKVAYRYRSTPGTKAGLHGNRVATPMPLGDARRPQAQLPMTKGIASLQHPPQTGRKQQAPKVSQLCPLKDF